MQETCKAVARISYSIFSSGKETKEPGEKLQLHLLNKPKMTSLNETQSKNIYGDSWQQASSETKILTTKSWWRNFLFLQSLPYSSDKVKEYSSSSWLELENVDGPFIPVFSILPLAPKYLFTNDIKYSSKSDGCKTKTCSCRKHGKLPTIFSLNSRTSQKFWFH